MSLLVASSRDLLDKSLKHLKAALFNSFMDFKEIYYSYNYLFRQNTYTFENVKSLPGLKDN